MVQGVHHIAIDSTDFDKSKSFYTDVLGLAVAKEWGEPGNRATMLATGDGSHLELFEQRGSEADPGRIIHFALRVDEVDSLIEKIRATGAKITTEPKDLDIPATPAYPVRLAFFEGPSGEVVELFKER